MGASASGPKPCVNVTNVEEKMTANFQNGDQFCRAII